MVQISPSGKMPGDIKQEEKNITQIDLDSAKQEFTKLLVAGEYKSQKTLDLVLNIWENADLSLDDAGWVLWVICDQHALGRVNDPITQNKYQVEFFELVKRNFPERLHWVVSDSTQAICQIRGGFGDFWWECYRFANNNAPCVAENRGVRFEAHRTIADSYMKFSEYKYVESALEAMARLIEEDPQWPTQQFASVTYKQQLFALYAVTGEMDKADETAEDLERLLDDWLQQIGDAKIVTAEEKPLMGSWYSFTADWPPANGLSVGLHNAAVAFARTGRYSAAEQMFHKWMDYRGRALNDYGQALFLRSCWHNRHNRDEIIRMLDESKDIISTGYLIDVAPEMADVIREERPSPS